MHIFVHLLWLLLSGGLLWFFSGIIIEAVNAVAERFHQSGFTVAFFVRGFITSLEEVAVMTNSLIKGVPEISAGNIVGASFVVLFVIVPVAAIFGKGVELRNVLDKRHLAIALLVTTLPVLFTFDGDVRKSEGLLALLVYLALLYFIQRGKWWNKKQDSVPEIIEEVEEEIIAKKHANRMDLLKVLGGALIIFVASDILVQQSIYFSNLLHIPGSVLGLLLLPIGTNLAGLVIAIQAVKQGRDDIAFGDYLGSAVANTVVFAFLALIGGPFTVSASDFLIPAILMVLGTISFFIFSFTKDIISVKEGIALFLFYVLFVMSQFLALFGFWGS
jgi:cation:H+ antiporter